MQAERKIENLHLEAPFHQRFGLLLAQSTEMEHGLDIMHIRQPAMFAFLGNQNLLDLIEPLVSSEITGNPIQHIRAKPPSSDGRSSWPGGGSRAPGCGRNDEVGGKIRIAYLLSK